MDKVKTHEVAVNEWIFGLFKDPKNGFFWEKQTSQNLRETLTVVEAIMTKFIWWPTSHWPWVGFHIDKMNNFWQFFPFKQPQYFFQILKKYFSNDLQ